MKKLLTISVFSLIGAFTGLIAQTSDLPKKPLIKIDVPGETVILRTNTQDNSKREAYGPEWFSPAETVRAFNGGPTSSYSYTTIFPDTNALFTYVGQAGDVTFNANQNSVGIVFDPRSDIYDGFPFKTDKWADINVDSMRFPFFYRRFNTDPNIVDTIVISVFDRTSITRGFTTMYAGAVNYTRDRYRASGTNVNVYTILLTKDDTSSTAQERVLAITKTVKGSNDGANYFGATISYLPGYRAYSTVEPFDTVANFVQNLTGPNRVNTFRLLAYYDQSMFTESTTVPPVSGARIYNHGIVAEPTQRYNLNNQIDYYFPAFYTTSHLFPAIEFYMASPNVSVTTLSNATIKSVYPNPAAVGTEEVGS